jgi:hypothetical protein
METAIVADGGDQGGRIRIDGRSGNVLVPRIVGREEADTGQAEARCLLSVDHPRWDPSGENRVVPTNRLGNATDQDC